MNKGLRALKKASPEAYASIMGMNKKELGKMANKGLKILKSNPLLMQYFSGGVVPHAVFTPIGMQAQHRQGMQNFVNAASNLQIPTGKEETTKTPKPEEAPQEMESKEPPTEIVAENVPTKGLKTSAAPAPAANIPMNMAMGGMKVMKYGGLYAENGKKNGEDEKEKSAQEMLAQIARANPGIEVRGSSADTARSLFDGMGSTTAVSSTAAPIAAFVDPRGDVAPQETPVAVRPEGLSPMRTLRPGVDQSRVPRELMGGIREIQTPEGPKYTFDFRGTSSYGGTPDSGHVAGSGSGGSSYDPSRGGQIGGLEAFGYEDGKRLGEGEMMGGRTGSSLFYLPGATGVPLYQDSPVNLMGSSSPILADIENMQSMDTGKYRNITDIYDLYGEDAYMSALGELQKQGIDIDKFDLPIDFDRPSMFDPNSPGLLAGLGKTSSDVVRSRASRSVDGRVVSGTGELGAPAFMGGTGKRATEGSGGREQRELIKYFQRKAEQAAEEFGPNSKEAKQFEDLIAQNLGTGGRLYMQGGKMYGMGGGVRPIKNYGRGGKY